MNKDLLKNKYFLIVLAVIIVLVISGGLLFKNLTSPKASVNTNILPTEIPVPTISASDLGLTIKAGALKQTVIISVEKTEGISAIEYELSYIAKGDIPRGAIGQLDMKKTPASKEVTLGTCSDVCHYDTDVKNIKAVLKITKTDGNVFQSTATLDTL